MNLITMIDTNNCKILIDLDELKNSNRLKNAFIFNRLFGFDDNSFKKEEMNKDNEGNYTLFKDFNISKIDWLSFINFIRNGKIEYDISSEYIKNIKQKNSYQKLFIQELDRNISSGIFLAFGPIPSFDKYVSKSINYYKNEKYNPMTPEEDYLQKYIWKHFLLTPDEPEWEFTCIVSDQSKCYRKLK